LGKISNPPKGTSFYLTMSRLSIIFPCNVVEMGAPTG